MRLFQTDAHLGYARLHLALPAPDPTQARAHLTEADWATLDAAFAANQDPLTGHPANAVFQPLFNKILLKAPAPIGLG